MQAAVKTAWVCLRQKGGWVGGAERSEGEDRAERTRIAREGKRAREGQKCTSKRASQREVNSGRAVLK